jgi:hypothetical protein
MTAQITDKPPVTPSRDWETWLRGGEEKRHIGCGECAAASSPPLGPGSRAVAYCGAEFVQKGWLAGAPRPEHCEACAIASAERMPCGPTCKRAQR